MIRRLINACLFGFCASTAIAANWVQIGTYNAFVDLSGVRQDVFAFRNATGMTYADPSGNMPTATYTVAWILFKTTDGSNMLKVETIFDCNGHVSPLQQIVENETKDSQYHSFDNTQQFRINGPRFSSIPPDSVSEDAAKMICKIKR